MKTFVKLSVIALATLAAACAPQIEVTATATPDTITLGEVVVLEGSATPAEDVFVFEWKVETAPTGSTAVPTKATEASTNFEPDVAGTYVLKFTAKDPKVRTGGGFASLGDSRGPQSKLVTLEVARVLSTLVFKEQPTDIVAGAAFDPVVEVELVIASEVDRAALGTSEVTLALNRPDGSTAKLIGTATVSAVDAIARFPGLSVDKVGTGYTLTASATDFGPAQSDAFDVRAGAVSLEKSSFTALPPVAVVGTGVVDLALNLRDAFGNAVAEEPASFSTTGTNNTLTPTSGKTDAVGLFAGTLMSTKAELKTITATFAAGSLDAKATFVAGPPDSSKSTLTVSKTTVTADGTDTTLVTVTLVDEYGNPVTGHDVTVSVSGSDNTFGSNGVGNEVTITTDENGVATVTLSSETAEDKDIEADPGFTPPLTTPVSFVPGEADLGQSTFTAAPSPVTANNIATTTLTATIRDAHGNVIAGHDVKFGTDGSNNTFGASTVAQEITAMTDSTGVATVTLKSTKAEVKNLTAKFGAAFALELTASVTFVAGAADVGASTFTAAPSPVDADGVKTTTLTATIKDVHGNVLVGHDVKFGTDGTSNTFGASTVAQETTGTTGSTGVATVTLKSRTAEVKSLTAKFGAAFVLSKTASVTFVELAPEVEIITVAGSLSSCGPVTYSIKQLNSASVDVRFEYQVGSGPWLSMTHDTSVGSEGVVALTSSEAGVQHTFQWNTNADLPVGAGQTVTIRVVPSLSSGGLEGDEDSRSGFTVSNGLKFGPETSTTISSNPQSNALAVGDVNGDGYPDLVTSTDAFMVQALLNDKAGGFERSIGSMTGKSNTVAVILGDFNNDGDLDVVTAQGTVAIGLGHGDGTFGDDSGLGEFRPDWIRVHDGQQVISVRSGDFDRNGFLDLVYGTVEFDAVGNVDGGRVYVALNDGVGDLHVTVPTGVLRTPIPISALLVADFNNDGKLDVALGGEEHHEVGVLWGDGLGGFSAPDLFDALEMVSSLAAADLNGDGFMDIVVRTGGNGVSILLNDRAGGFKPAVEASFQFGTMAAQIKSPVVEIRDMDNDGKLDLIVGSGPVYVMRGRGDGTFEPGLHLAFANHGHSIVEDFNLDGRLDIAATSPADRSAKLRLNETPYRCDPGFVPSLAVYDAITGPSGGFIVQGDFDNDGSLDLMTHSGSNVGALWGTPSGVFDVPANNPGSGQAVAQYSGPAALAAADFNRDGKLDIVVALAGAQTYRVFLNDGNRAFTVQSDKAASTGAAKAENVVAVDIDNDGSLDLIIATSEGGTNVAFGRGDGTFDPIVEFAAGAMPSSDSNRPPLAMCGANIGRNLVAVVGVDAEVLAYSGGTLMSAVSIPDFHPSIAIDVVDVNHDGQPDAISASYDPAGNATLRVLATDINDPSGFVVVDHPASIGGATGLALADFEGKGVTDFFVPGVNGDLVVISNQAMGAPAALRTFPLEGVRLGRIVTGDYNRDGRPDVAVVDTMGRKVRVLLSR